jgi:hypothetical protein
VPPGARGHAAHGLSERAAQKHSRDSSSTRSRRRQSGAPARRKPDARDSPRNQSVDLT